MNDSQQCEHKRRIEEWYTTYDIGRNYIDMRYRFFAVRSDEEVQNSTALPSGSWKCLDCGHIQPVRTKIRGKEDAEW